MSGDRPPKGLSEGLKPLWRYLHEADESAPSRQALAARLGVSTRTLQRLLVDGDLPRFRSGATTREVHSWTRILTRLAVHFDREPRPWIEAAGIRWDESIAGIVKDARHALLVRRSSRSAARASARSDRPEWPALEDPPGAAGFRVAIADRGPFSARLPRFGASFLELFARRLIGAVEPNTPVDVTPARPASPSTGRPHLLAGVARSASGRRLGSDLLTIPGFQVPLVAARLLRSAASPPREPEPGLSWNRVYTPVPDATLRLAVARGSVADRFARGQCGWAAAELFLAGESHPSRLASELVNEFDALHAREPRASLVFIGEDEELARVAPLLEEHGVRLEEIPGGDRAPAYPLAVELAGAPLEWVELLTRARDEDLFEAARMVTARHYAALLTSAVFQAAQGGVGSELRVRPGHCLAAFAGASDAFLDELLRAYVAMMVSAPPLPPRWGEGAEPATVHREAFASVAPAVARRRALALAPSVLPEAWRARFQEALGEAPAGDPQLCQSCSASIPHHRGASETFCEVCSDERGALRPRDEVERILADWLGGWYRGLTPREALAGASRFMAGMPAWSRN